VTVIFKHEAKFGELFGGSVIPKTGEGNVWGKCPTLGKSVSSTSTVNFSCNSAMLVIRTYIFSLSECKMRLLIRQGFEIYKNQYANM
jgi:hypothetical protein